MPSLVLETNVKVTWLTVIQCGDSIYPLNSPSLQIHSHLS